MRTYRYKSYGIAAVRVVGNSVIAACIRSFSVVKWSLTEGEVTKSAHGGSMSSGREQVSRVNHASDHVASKG